MKRSKNSFTRRPSKQLEKRHLFTIPSTKDIEVFQEVSNLSWVQTNTENHNPPSVNQNVVRIVHSIPNILYKHQTEFYIIDNDINCVLT